MVSIVVHVHFIILSYCFEIIRTSISCLMLLIFQYIRPTCEDITKNLILNVIMISGPVM